MSYPRNAASPPVIAVGAIYLLADGTIQTTGASARVKTGSGAWGAAAGTLACDTTSGVWTYAPTQAETDAESFLIAVYKSASTTAQVTVATSASATAGYSGVDWGKVTAATSTVSLSGTTISTTQAVASVTAAVTVGTNNDKTGYSLTAGTGMGNQTANITGNLSGSVGSVTAGVTVSTNNDKTGYSLTVTPPTAAAVADAVWDEATSGHTTAGTYGGQIVRSTNSNVAVQITGSNHIAADVHEFQADSLTSAATDATFVSEVQSGLATSAALATVDSNVDTLVARITSTLFSGITSMASWLGALAGKSTDASTLAEIQSTTAGATFANSTDSLEAIRDRGDAAWAPGEAGSGDASQSTLLAVQDQVEAIAGTLGGTAISVTSRIADGGSMVIYTGDDLKVRSGTQVTVSISDAAGGIYSRLSAIGTSNLSWGAARPSQAAGAISGTISSITQSGSGDDQVVNLVIEILDAGQSLNPADDYIWQVASTSSSGDEYTEVEGTLDLRRRVAVPVTV